MRWDEYFRKRSNRLTRTDTLPTAGTAIYFRVQFFNPRLRRLSRPCQITLRRGTAFGQTVVGRLRPLDFAADLVFGADAQPRGRAVHLLMLQLDRCGFLQLPAA